MPAKNSKPLPVPPSLIQTIGPSFILLGLALGSGELILWPYLAANWGLGLIWGALLGITLQFVLNTEVMRYSLAWGESVFTGFRKISIFITLWYIISTFIPWSIPGFSSASSDILVSVMPFLPTKPLAIGLLLITGLIISAGKSVYKTMEILQKSIILLGLPFILIITVLLTNNQDWLEFSRGLYGHGNGWWLFPPGVAIASFLGAFAYAGAGGNLNLAQSYYIKEKGFGMGKYAEKITSIFSSKSKAIKLDGQIFESTPTNRARWNSWWSHVNTEHFLVFWLLGFITISILSVLAKSTAFGVPTESGISFLYTEAAVITERINPFMGTFFLLVAALMLFSTQLGVLESSSRIISENVLLLFYKKGMKVDLSKAFYIALWSQIILGIIVYSAGFTEPRLLLTLSAVLNAAAMMSSFVFIYWLNRRSLRKELQPSLWRKVLMLVAVLFFGYFLFITSQNFQI